MFEDFTNKCAMADGIKPNKKRTANNISAVKSLIEHEGKAPKKRRVKFKPLIVAVVAVALSIGGGTAAILLKRPVTADNEVGAPEIAEGKYYLNGDVNSGAYFELTDSTLKLNFECDGYAMVYDACINEGWDEWNADHTANMFLLDYCKENPYTVFNLGHLTTIDIERHYANMNDDGTPADDTAAFKYDGKSISCSPLGKFTLVK